MGKKDTKGVVREGIEAESLLSLLYQPARLTIMEHLREKNDTAVLLALRMGLKRKQVTPHIKVLHDFGLIKRLPRSASPFDPSKKSVYQLYGITTKGLQLLQMYEKKPEV